MRQPRRWSNLGHVTDVFGRDQLSRGIKLGTGMLRERYLLTNLNSRKALKMTLFYMNRKRNIESVDFLFLFISRSLSAFFLGCVLSWRHWD